jgi:hypothetical protein
MTLHDLRKAYHQGICTNVLRITQTGLIEYPNFADGNNRSSVEFAWGVYNQLQCMTGQPRIAGQTAGGRFEVVTREFLRQAFALLSHLRPGEWHYAILKAAISDFEQYEHLAEVDNAIRQNPSLASALGSDYIITPDIIIGRWPVSDAAINAHAQILTEDDKLARLTPFRAGNRVKIRPILHASISCKWTIRSDRAQNTRAEALNLIRNRKGNLPHVVAVTAEPLPTRLAALALGTGDLDCIYHFALPELQEVVEKANNQDQLEMLQLMINGRRLRDISDLPFDLAI